MDKPLVEKNKVVTVEITDLSHDGHGVAKIKGYTLFIPNTLPGEIAKIKIIKVKKHFGFAQLVELKQKSSERVHPLCKVYKKCGGCQLQHLSYPAQLIFKQKKVKEVLHRIGHLDINVKQTIGMDEPFRYRNKSQVPVGFVDGKIQAGFYQKRSHRIIDMDTCLIQAEPNDEAVQIIRQILTKYGVSPYSEERNDGDIRYIMTRSSYFNLDLMVVLITRKEDFLHKNSVIQDLVAALGKNVSIVQNINSQKTNVILGEKSILLHGKKAIIDTIHGITFSISAHSFYQINPKQTEILYQKALELAKLKGTEIVIDAYCGIGSISLCLAKSARHVYAVEVIDQAIQDARFNAALNGIKNVTFETGKAEEVISNWYKEGVRPEIFVVDPPRKGCDKLLLQIILKMKPEKVVYISCDPSTLARDLQILLDGGYKAQEVQPVDMFPMTTHIENVVLLTRS